MKTSHLIAGLFFALVSTAALAHTTVEQDFTCPIDGKKWRQYVDASGTRFGLRLDLKPLGPTAAPWTAPQCPKCRFVLYDDDLDKAAATKLKPYILSKEYQDASKGQPTYFCIALIQTFLGAEADKIGHSYLRASWQTESKPKECRKHLESALDSFSKALSSLKPDSEEFQTTATLCCELERRTERFEAARKRCDALLGNGGVKNEILQKVLERESKFIASKDSAPHAMTDEQEERLMKDGE